MKANALEELTRLTTKKKTTHGVVVGVNDQGETIVATANGVQVCREKAVKGDKVEVVNGAITRKVRSSEVKKFEV